MQRHGAMKRQKEVARQQKQRDKEAARLQRKKEKERAKTDGGEDPDLIGIEPGPQSPPESPAPGRGGLSVKRAPLEKVPPARSSDPPAGEAPKPQS